MFQRCFSAFCLSSYWVTFNKLIWRDKKRGPIPPQELWSSGKQTNKKKNGIKSGLILLGLWHWAKLELWICHWNIVDIENEASHAISCHFTCNEESLKTLTCISDMAKWEEFMDFLHFLRFSPRRCQAICWLSLKYWEQNNMSRDCL